MTQKSPDEIKAPALHQIGIAVRDVDKVVQNYWNILGIGPWNIITLQDISKRMYRGKPAYFETKAALAQVGSVELEVTQTLEGHTTYCDFLAEHGEGAHHLQYLVDSEAQVDKHLEIMTKKGFPPVMSGRVGNNGAFAYSDTVSALATIWESVKMPDVFGAPIVQYPADESAISPAKIKVKEIKQVSLAVKNLEETMKNYWNLFGIGPWNIVDCTPPFFHNLTYYGKSASFTLRAGWTKCGPVELELIQPVAGDGLGRDHLCKHGEGINHLAFAVDDVEETVRLMEAEGFPCVQYGKIASDGAYAYFDTLGPLKVYWEAFKLPTTSLPISMRYPE